MNMHIALRLSVLAISGIVVFITSIFIVGTFVPIGFGCVYYGGLTMIAGTKCSRYDLGAVAFVVPFLIEDWGDALGSDLLILFGSWFGCFVSKVMFPDD